MAEENPAPVDALRTVPVGSDVKSLIKESICELRREEPTLLNSAPASQTQGNDQSRGEFCFRSHRCIVRS